MTKAKPHPIPDSKGSRTMATDGVIVDVDKELITLLHGMGCQDDT